MLSWASIEQGLERFLELVRADPRVLAEFARSRAEFFTDPTAARGPMDQIRHQEWFLLERPSAALGSPPAQAWQDRWRAASPAAGADLSAAFLQSIPGAFEVTSLVPSEGAWLRDLFTMGEHPVAQADAISNLTVGDLLVGRLFPAGAGTFLLSPSVSVFRNPALLVAIRADLAAMRAVRRGVLRVQQLELERLFHGPGAEPEVQKTSAQIRARVRAELLEQGLESSVVADLMARVQDAARSSRSQVITDSLNGLAFDTGVDLTRTRIQLVELWDSERRHAAAADAAPLRAEVPPDARAALAAFDRGRAAGQDLEQLFRELERDLGIDEGEEDSAELPEGVPDFPGVIAAVVEEFLWEVEREHGPERARRWSVLRTLGDYARDIGVFEELGSTHLLDFCTRWLLDESGLASVAQVETLMEALAAFCQWCEEQHDVPLWRQFGTTLSSLRASVPRHVLLRQHGAAPAGRGSYRVVRVGEREALVSDPKGRERSVTLTPHQAAHLRDGDLVRLARAGGRPALGATYPGELEASFFRVR